MLSRLHNQHIVRYFQAWIEWVDDPQEIKDLNFSEEDEPMEGQTYYDDYIAEHTSENDTYNNNYDNELESESRSSKRKANSFDQS